MSFVFFDTETTGLKPGFDQILQFAAVRTDADLNEVARFNVRCRLLPYVLPHPTAFVLGGHSIEQLTDPSLPSHYEMVGQIHQTLLGWSPAIFVGFNSIRFDEEMLRHAFFQNLFPAYLTSSAKCGRADALSLVMAAGAASPSQLIIPKGVDGRPSFRLHDVAKANGVAGGRAHDALADALLTLELCRRVREQAPEVWQGFVRFTNKAAVADFVETEDSFVLTEFFGAQAYHTPVTLIGRDPENPNGRLCLRLDQGIEPFGNFKDAELRSLLATKPSPIRRLRVNAGPTLTATFDACGEMLAGATAEEIDKRGQRVKNDAGLRERLASAYTASREPYPLSPHLEERLYASFPSQADEARMQAFHKASWSERVAIAEALEDERLRWFAIRLIYVEARSALPKTALHTIEGRIIDQLLDNGDGRLSYDQALAAVVQEMRNTPTFSSVLGEYRAYLLQRKSRAQAHKALLPTQ